MSMGRAASKGWLAGSSRLVIVLASVALGSAPLRAQIFFGNPYDARFGMPYTRGTPWALSPSFEPGVGMEAPPAAPAGTISSDLLKHPLSRAALRLLRNAQHLAELGDHAAAIGALREALVKQPAAAPYIHNMLGGEYLRTHQFAAAVASLAEAVRIMPHETAVHSNYGLSLAVTGQFDLAEKELRQALALDHTNEKARNILEALVVTGRASRQPAQ